MDERNDADKLDEVMLPGFRFHPTDEELVGFYLKRKIQQKPLSIELIKQLDIYKYDPWDLPKLASIGEKEWYFYCPRDRKYRNSARPNRVTEAGFWKATGTDRPIYNSEGSKCIGLKKSLVFYKGRAAKGMKTDWMMHEFRLPSTTDHSVSSKQYLDRNNLPANDAWAICRIFKKTNSAAQRAPSHSWVSPITETTTSDHMLTQHVQTTTSHLTSDFMSLPTKTSSSNLQFCSTMNLEKSTPADHKIFTSPLNLPSYKTLKQMASDLTTNYTFSSAETILDHEPSKPTINDASSLLLNMSSSIFGDFAKETSQTVDYNNGGMQDQQCSSSFSVAISQDLQGYIGHGEETGLVKNPNVVNLEDQWGTIRSVEFPYSLPLSLPDAWRSNLLWESSPSLSEISTNYSTNNGYT